IGDDKRRRADVSCGWLLRRGRHAVWVSWTHPHRGVQVKYLYIRCNGGHYYRSRIACPFDGWSCDGLAQATTIFDQLAATERGPSVERLREKGVPDAVLNRLVILEFGNDASAFEALAPERYIHQGREVLAHEVDESLF